MARPSLAARRQLQARPQPVTAVEVEQELLRLMSVLEQATEDLAAFARDAAETEVNHKMLYAQAFASSHETSDARRKEDATHRTFHAHRARQLAEATYLSQRELLLTLRAELDALRSIGANIRNQT